MSAYWIGRATVRDPAGMQRYNELRIEAAKLHPQQSLVRTADRVVLEGPDRFDRHVVIRFDSVEDAVRYYHSPEYQVAAAIRQASCDACELVIVPALD